MTRALVLGGGGVTGVAWELGVVEGLRRAGVDLGDADVVFGTSAGSVVGTRLRLGTIAEAFEEQLADASGEIAAKIGTRTMIKLVVMMSRRTDEATKFKKIGKASRETKTVTAAERREVIRTRVGDPEWPAGDLRITAIDIDNGRLEIFDRTSGVSVLDAVSASCAVPLVWPPVTINGTTYVDGGARSPVNADLAGGGDVAVVIAPMPDAVSKEHHLDKQLERAGFDAHVSVVPDKDATEEMGSNSLDPTRRRPSAEAGLRQGLAAAGAVAALWNR
ncbi:NTE family protein [Marmoricola sp. OAE513]|uniref:patatin-like phospholipase family protein n=1 Tax=Marmoricola sp. OAE513 TaxID=2817894 RepID=UPI001AE64847